MQLYFPSRLVTLDMDESQLSDEEQLEYIERSADDNALEKERHRERMRKRHSFRFVAGML